MNKSICIMGASTSTNNMGVSALSVSLVNIFNKLAPEYDLFFVIGNKSSNPQVINSKNGDILIPTVFFRLSPKSNFKDHLLVILFVAILQNFIPFLKVRTKLINFFPVLKAIRSSDIIADIHGGDSFSDIYGLLRFIISSFPLIISVLLHKRLIFLPQTYGPFKNRIAQFISNFLLQKAHIVFCRDSNGVKEINKKSGELLYCPDVAFTLEPIKPNHINILPEVKHDVKRIIGLNINGLMYNGGYTRNNMFGLAIDYKQVIEDIVSTLISKDNHIVLVPHTYGGNNNVNSDNLACEEIIKKINDNRLHILKDKYNQSELKYIISNFDLFIGSRMHSCIASISSGVPTIGLAYSKKFKGIFDPFEEICLVIDCRNTNHADIISHTCEYLTQDIYKLKEKIKPIIENTKSDIFSKLNKIFIN